MKKKILLMLMVTISSIFLIGILNVSAATYGDLTYTIIDEEVIITDSRNWTTITIPSSINGYPVTTIGDNAFEMCAMLKSIKIPDSVTTIGAQAFYDCRSLESVDIPPSVKKIGRQAFAFCDNLKTINITDLQSWCNIDFANNTANPTSNSGGLYLNGNLINDLCVLDKISVINNYAFYGYANFENITIANSVEMIGFFAFSNCPNLESVRIGNGIIDISSSAFYECENLMYVSIGNGVKSIGAQAFAYCYALAEIDIGGGLESVGESAFWQCNNLKKVNISDIKVWCNIQFDSIYANPLCCAKQLYINGVLAKTLVIPSEVERIKNYTFYNCENLTNIILPQNISTIGKYSFKGCAGLTNIIIPNCVYEVGDYAFYNCTNLKTISLPKCVSIIGDSAFYNCSNLKEIYIDVPENAFFDAITLGTDNNKLLDSKLKQNYDFVGYFSEKNGKGKKIANENGELLIIHYSVCDFEVYPYFYSDFMNKVEVQCVEAAMPGDTITLNAVFSTEKDATYFIATVKYPKYLNFKSIKGVDFKEATKDSEKVVDDYKYSEIICVFDYEGNFTETNTNYIPFEIKFDISTDTPEENYEISIENAMLVGEDTFDITDVKNHTLTIIPKLAESIEIAGKDEIDASEHLNAIVYPNYTADKSVVWSVNDESVATISQDGILTPVKNGKVIVTATAKDGSEVFATKTVNVIAYAKINSLDFDGGVVLTEFNPDVRKYTVYVKENVSSISLTPTFSGGGVLRPNGSGIWVSGRSKDFELNDTVTTITLNRENVSDMTNSIYTVEIVKFEGTKTEVSEDKKSFTITPINIENGKTVILALYNGEQFVKMQSVVYTGKVIPFTTTKTYTKVKVMVWEIMESLKPVCEVEEIIVTQ